MKKLILSIVVAFGLSLGLQAQHTIGGTPFGLLQNMSSTHNIDSKTLTPLNLTQLAQEDAIDEKMGTWPRIAQAQSVSYNLQNSGVWTNLSNGDRVWRLKVSGSNAQGIIFSFNDFYIPPGAKMYAYSEDGLDVLGGFTFANNPSAGYISIGMIPQGSAILEYYEPAVVTGQGHFNIYEVAQAYRILSPQAADSRDFGDSDPCQVNVNCTPEGSAWQDEKRGVARILLKDGPSWGWCTGSLVNNTAQDCSPYFLTAHHCGETSSAADRAQWYFYFNYESSGCSNGSNPVPNAYSPPAGFSYVQGCTQLSHANDGGGVSGSDYKLLNLTNLTTTDMVNWNLYLNGWDATDPGGPGGDNGPIGSTGWNTATGIHHPSGDIKKISSTTGNLTTTQWNGAGLPSHWYITWNSSTNGHGVTEGGSSGSPLFNSSGRLVGTLTGGSSYCSSPSSPDMYGKMSYHWDENANPTGGHLGVFLDPVGGGTSMVLDGTYAPCSPTAPNCAASASATTVVVGQNVDFFDNSTGIPTSWTWDFGDASPTSSLQNPSHAYTAPGTYTVTLTATNAQGTCTTTLIITVTASTGCDTLNFPPPGTLTIYTAGAGNGYVAGTNTYGDIAKAQRFASYAPYTHTTGSVFYLAVANDGGNGAIARFTVWDENAGTPNTALSTVDIDMATLETILAGNPTLIQLFWNNPVNVAGNPFYVGVEMVGFGAGDTIALVTNTIGDPVVLGQSWEMWSDFTWHAYNDAGGWGIELDNFISPYMTDSPPTVGMTSNLTSVCEGSSINFDGSTSTNYDSLEWVFVGGTPNISTNVTETVMYNTGGTYTAYLQAYGACGGYALDSIPNIVVTPSPTLTGTVTDATCQNTDGVITSNATGGSGAGYQYSIDGGVTFQGSGTFSGLTPGTYTIIVTDGAGCQTSEVFTVNSVNSPITVTGTTTDENCGQADGTITITAAGATQFSINAGINFQASNVFTGLVAGSYDIVVEDANGCTGTTTLVVNGNASAPTITNTAGTDENCGNADGTITITATGGQAPLTYSIDGTTFQSSNNFTGLTAGTYTVYVEDANGCQNTDMITLLNLGGPTITNVVLTDATCNGANDGSITITATTPSGTLTYSIDGTTYQASNTFTGVAPGTYTVYADNGACITTDGPHVISEPTLVTHTVNVTDAGCTNNGVIDVTATGGSGSFQYSIDGGSNYQASNSFTGLSAGTYQVIVIDANGCTSVLTNETVNSLPALIATATGADETCLSSNGSISINATGGDGNYQYSIDGGTNYQGSGTFTGLSAGTYNISVIDASGCSDTQVITISNTGGVTLTTNGNQTICDGQSASMSASGAVNYNWFDGATPIGVGNSINVSPSVTTTYTVVGDDGTCGDTANVTITVNTTPVTTVTPDTSICDGESIVLTAQGGTSYFWTHSGETTSSVTVTPTGASQTYSVVAFNGACQGSTASVTITINPAAVANAGSDVTTTYLGSGGTVNFNNTGSTGVSYGWTFGDGGTSTSSSPTHNYTAPGTYTVILTATLGPCTDTDTLIITVLNGVGVEESDFSQGITVYPNPTDGFINLNFDLDNQEEVLINVVDAVGKVVYQTSKQSVQNNTFNIDLTQHAKGVYFVVIRGENNTHSERVTLMK